MSTTADRSDPQRVGDHAPWSRRVPLAVVLDTFVVVLFVAIGRRNHDEDPGVTGLFETALPFLIGLVVAWLIVRAWRRPTDIGTGVALWPIVVLVGMLLRRGPFDEGTALAFVIVAALFIGIGLVGWRATAAVLQRRSDRRRSVAAA